MKAHLYIALFASFCCCSFSMATEVYKTVDEYGRVTYSDKPKNESSVKVELNDSNYLPPPAPSTASSTVTVSDEPTSYTVTITSPEDEFHVLPGTFDLTVATATDPEVHPDHKIIVTDNGQRIDGSTVKNIHRGTHLLTAEVFNSNGKSLGRSDAITVYVHRPGLNNKPKP